MKKLACVALMICLAFSIGCETARKSNVKYSASTYSANNRSLMIGKWLGEMVNDQGEQQKWLVTRSSDGTYKIQFQTSKPGAQYCREQIEVGTWGVSGPIYFTTTKGALKGDQFLPADLEDPVFYDAYEILYLDEDTMKYHHVDMDVTFQVHKVADDFELP